MIIKELYEWAVSIVVENYDIEIQYRDDGGYCQGVGDCEPAIHPREHSYNTEKVVLL